MCFLSPLVFLSSPRKVAASPTTPQFLSPTAQRSLFSSSFTNTVSFTLPEKIINSTICIFPLIASHLQSSCLLWNLWNIMSFRDVVQMGKVRRFNSLVILELVTLQHLQKLFEPFDYYVEPQTIKQ